MLLCCTQNRQGFSAHYKLGTDLGKGAFSVVYFAQNIKTKESVAVKVVLRKKLTKEDERALRAEVAVLTEVRGHAGIIFLHEHFEEPQKHYLVLELMTGGELFHRLVKRDSYSEVDAAKVLSTVAGVLEHIHSKDICHRDLKPENILLKDREEDAQVKIADFGFARHVGSQGCKTACGTPAYVAPEVVSGKIYSTPCDIWSLGVILYVLLCGYPPFYARTRHDLFKLIRAGDVKFDPQFWSKVSDEAKDLIKGMMCVDMHARLTAKQVLEHAWVRGAADRDGIDAKALRLFNAKRQFRGAFTAAIAAGRIQDLVKQVKKAEGGS